MRKLENVTDLKAFKNASGFVCIGCEDPEEWEKGIPMMLSQQVKNSTPTAVLELLTKENRTDLVFLFKDINEVELSIWIKLHGIMIDEINNERIYIEKIKPIKSYLNENMKDY